MKWNLFVFLLGLFLCASKLVVAQASDRESQKKIFLKLNCHTNTVYQQVAVNKSFVFLYPTKESKGGPRDWEIVEIDTNLSVINRKIISCTNTDKYDVLPIKSYKTTQLTYLLTTPKSWLFSSQNWLVTYDLSTRNATSKLIDIKQIGTVKHIIRVGNSLIISGEDKKNQPKLTIYDIYSGQLKPIPFSQTFEAAIVSEMVYREDTKQTLLILTVLNDKRKFDNRIFVLDSLNNVIVNKSLIPAKRYGVLLTNTRLRMTDSSITLLGSYSYFQFDTDKDFFLNPPNGYPLGGFFVIKLNSDYDVTSHSINPARDLVSLQNLILKVDIRDSIENEHNAIFDFRFNDVYCNDSSYVILGEIFKPKYKYVNLSYGYVTSSVPVFVGYYFTCFVAIMFDKNGSPIGEALDNFDFRSTTKSDAHSWVIYHGDEWKVLYKKENKFVEMGLLDDSGPTLSNFEVNSPKCSTYNPMIQIYSQEIISWYGNRILLFGYQGDRSNYSDGPDQNRVFYLKKM